MLNQFKNLVYLVMLCLSMPAHAQSHLHPKHNMLLYGQDEIHAYHLVYKSPHNYQVILSVQFNDEVKKVYQSARQEFPKQELVLLLDSMDISKIGDATLLEGALLRQDDTGKKVILDPKVVLTKKDFKILFFDELPLSLEGQGHPPNL